MKLLLVEDEPAVVSVITRGLAEAGYEVSVAPDGASGLRMALDNRSFLLIILDVMLPNMNGIEVCRALRAAQIATPILMLTALGTTENIVMGLDSGADDYLVKPFKLAELEARIRSLTRRKNNITAPVTTPELGLLQLGDLELNTDTKAASRQGKNIQLTATEYRLLEYLMKNPRKVLSRMELLEQVWGIDFNMNTKVVDVYINYLRKKINKNNLPELIQTVTGLGYMLKEQKADENTH
ncbi:DNA-binding response regulator, OmpR family, contains REC and winged-helix (wHTH) domain [Chitinophaga eiseniae]|uniref:DNA-binding response regulator, OmpR family, contains REC and winged-helix (WHTH) domain n=1 Tax=Chitinophaga eiseniae TaxID=634771 RepID=A0A1T4PY88_9BACT|nr:response regulator transcription factor [Chitinophaga eiseniae]SJZ96475.1 DNA-binding response regulator, OmpR family, contains REC and winged-helix (wHTH) domain [Chitinophaga eiseniae]